ncbi:MAG TPA: ribose 5-phosphate isomerase B [Patescibacteria group bacterium]|nr:ribose 5-phosphate isomerase B [Patescibacteria group bacterium]
MRIAIGSDHRGFQLKERLKTLLVEGGHEVIDAGCAGTESVDYPDYAFPVAERVSAGEVERGILVCGSGIGMSIAANKVKGVRAALCRSVDDARMTREHNDSNVLALSEHSMEDPALERLVAVWLETAFQGDRHKRRIDKIHAYERARDIEPGDYVSC